MTFAKGAENEICDFIVASLILLASPAHAVDKHGNPHPPKHGGIISEHKEVELELVAKPDVIQLHVRDHDGKARDISKASAKVTLLTGKEKQEVELKPAGGVLEAKGAFNVGKGTKAVAVLRGVTKGDVTGRFAMK